MSRAIRLMFAQEMPASLNWFSNYVDLLQRNSDGTRNDKFSDNLGNQRNYNILGLLTFVNCNQLIGPSLVQPITNKGS